MPENENRTSKSARTKIENKNHHNHLKRRKTWSGKFENRFLTECVCVCATIYSHSVFALRFVRSSTDT